MSLRERVEAFSEAARSRFGLQRKTDLRKNFGVSNSAKIVEGGIQLGVSNLDGFSAAKGQLVLGCMIRFPPEDEVYFAIQVKSDLAAFVGRLEEMKARGAAQASGNSGGLVDDEEETDEPEESEETAKPEGELLYSVRNHLTAVYLAADDGRLYFRNKQFWNSLKFDLSSVGPGVEIDQIMVSVWPPAASARRSLLARQFIGYLASLVGREKVHEVQVWSDAGEVSTGMRRMPATLKVADLEAGVADLGGHYPGGEVARFHGALNFLEHKHFVILSGLSGTGKTQLALKYARAVHGLKDMSAPDPFLFVCPVRPEWTDPSGLTGYYDVLSDRYVVPPFLEAVLLATAHRDSPVFVVLDEMNLARVEYYFSDVLSAIETGEALQLHSSGVPLEGSTGTAVPAALPVPPNLYLIGTINVDETTNAVSDKVLDRAMVMDMSRVDLEGFLDKLVQREPGLAPAVETAGAGLIAVHAILASHGLGFGYRVAEEVVRYHDFAGRHLKDSVSPVLDDLMVQKVLVKLRGSERQRPMLGALSQALAGMPQSQALIGRLQTDLDEFGSFQAGR
ncbi:hypothetical protein D3C87_321220 [compost metagenome]